MPSTRFLSLSLWCFFVAGACTQDLTSAGADLFLAHDGRPSVRSPELPLYGQDRPHGRDREACRRNGFRGFDFWLGNWDVFAPTKEQVGTNRVLSGVDGCAILENWTDQAGNRGRSLNTFDAGTGRWHQLWMDASGLALIVEGTASNGRMQMSGDAPRQFGGPIVAGRITWTRLSGNQVRQFWEESLDGHQTWTSVFDGDYQRRRQVTPAPEKTSDFCLSSSRPRYLWFDFLVGEWTVRRESDTGRVLGQLSVTKDLGGCLVESDFRGKGGYQGRAFAANHFPTRTWYRDWIDSDGIRVALTGALMGASMVMTGERTRPHGVIQKVRATWSPASADRVDERWETSTDGGATWAVEHLFVLIRS
ncbi:MAG: hypothetical protein HOP28_17375 [Gemmatimonadales bacterium]|nr:hypothetical protein [Gemmatimonadales bacterium]